MEKIEMELQTIYNAIVILSIVVLCITCVYMNVYIKRIERRSEVLTTNITDLSEIQDGFEEDLEHLEESISINRDALVFLLGARSPHEKSDKTKIIDLLEYRLKKKDE